MISQDEARALADEWRPKFDDEERFSLSWTRYFDSATVPDAGRLAAWLDRDLQAVMARHEGVVPEPLLPTRSGYELSGCYHCRGRGFVRLDVELSHPDFGKARLCPACGNRGDDRAAHCERCAAYGVKGAEEDLGWKMSERVVVNPNRNYVAELARQWK